MVSFTSATLSSALLAAIYMSSVSAAPTRTSNGAAAAAARTVPQVATHSVIAGLGGLHFDPQNVVASIGDIVEFHFLAANHSVAQSSFDSPCAPLVSADAVAAEIGFFSGFVPTPAGSQNPNVFSVTVTDDKPIWYYCAQTKGDHCQMGMAGVVNQNFDNGKTLAVYQAKAAEQLGVQKSVAPARVGGGVFGPNPNPLGGF